MSHMTKRGLAAVLTALCCTAVSCSAENGSGRAPGTTVEPPVATASQAAEGATAIDVCSLLSADDITALLETPVSGHPYGAAGCTWENPSTYESVSVEIGNPGTVVNNTLPAPEPGFPAVGTPGPDGMRFLGSGMVEFPAGGRSNTVQVAVLRMSGDEANNAAVELAQKIGPKIPN